MFLKLNIGRVKSPEGNNINEFKSLKRQYYSLTS